MRITKSEFVISVAEANAIPDYGLPEIAIAGKSNVGKSSFINLLTNVGGLAKVSQEPGRTRLLNYFLINKQFYLVDLPGYGFAKVSDREKKRWARLTDTYFTNNPNLKTVFVLLDSRHLPTQDDLILINYLNQTGIPYTVIATKCDKLSKAQQRASLTKIAAAIKMAIGNIIPTSAKDKVGVQAVCDRIEQILELNAEDGNQSQV